MSIEALAIIVPAVAVVAVAVISLIHQGRVTGRTLDHQADLNRATLDHQAALSEATLDHQRQIARDERVQERIASTYVEMLEMLDWIMGIVNATQPIMEPGPESPPEPDTETVRGGQARIGAFGSPEVKEIIYTRWIPTRNEFFAEAGQLAVMRKAQDVGRDVQADYGLSVGSQYMKVDGLRRRLHGIVRELEDRANEELRG